MPLLTVSIINHKSSIINSPLTAKIRYRSKAVPVKEIKSAITNDQSQISSLIFSEPIWGITPGQSVVLYQDDLVIGGGIIV